MWIYVSWKAVESMFILIFSLIPFDCPWIRFQSHFNFRKMVLCHLTYFSRIFSPNPIPPPKKIMVYAWSLLDNSSFFKRYFLFYLWGNSTSLEIEVLGVRHELSFSLTGWPARISTYSSIAFPMPTWLFQSCVCEIHIVRTKARTLLRSGQVYLHLSHFLWLFPLETQLEDRAWLQDL